MRRLAIFILFSAAILVGGWSVLALSSTPTITWSIVDGGGDTLRTAGEHTLGATIGQHEAAQTVIGVKYTLAGGFWGVISRQTHVCVQVSNVTSLVMAIENANRKGESIICLERNGIYALTVPYDDKRGPYEPATTS